MIKHAGAAIAACLYIAMSAWLVGAVGRAYREREMPKAPVPDAPTPPESRGETVALAKPAPVPTPRELPAPTPSIPSARPPELAKAEPQPAPAIVPAPTSASEASSVRNNSVGPKSAAAPKSSGTFRDLSSIDPFFASPQAARRWDLSMNPAREAELGRDLKDMVLRFNQPLTDGKLQRRLYDAAKPLEKAVSRKEVEYHYTVLDSKTINAFSHPGGYVYVTKGLLDWIGEDDEHVLQFALAHEIYHVDQGHALRCLEDPGFRKMPYGTVPLFYLFIFPYGYRPDALDYDADAWAVRQLVKLQHTRRECLTFLRRLDGYEEDQGSIEGHLPPQRGDLVSLFENHYRAHASARKRLEKAEFLFSEPATRTR